MLKNFMARLFRSAPAIRIAAPLIIPEPTAASTLAGFTVSVERKPGVLLTSKPKDWPSAESNPASVDFYYAVTVESDGSNPEYPQQRWTLPFTTALSKEEGYGLMGAISFAPAGSHWLRFQVVEAYDDGALPDFPCGSPLMPAHHYAALKASFVDAQGRTLDCLAGLAVRQSMLNSEAWKIAEKGPRYF